MTDVNEFNVIVRETFTKLLELHPEESVNLGLGVVDKPFPDLSQNTIPIERGLIRIQLDKLEKIDPSNFPLDKKVDYYAFVSYLKLRLFFLDEWPIWKMYPEAPDIAFSMILSVYLSENLSPKEKAKYLLSKIEELPLFLEKSKSRLETPIQLFIDAGILSTRNLIGLLKGIYNDFISDTNVSKMVIDKKSEFDECIEALEKYITWLQEMRDKEIKDYTMGKELYEKLLHFRRIDSNINELKNEVKRDIETYKNRMLKAKDEIDKVSSVPEILELLSKDSPKSSSIARSIYQQGLLEIKKFIKEKNIMTLPDIEVEIKLVPSMIRDVIPLIYYLPVFHQIGELKNVYILVNVSDDPAILKMHNVYVALHRLLRLAYPGFHTIFSRSIESRNYVRMLLDIPEVMEGWAIYSDFLIGEYGFLNSPKDRFVRYLTLYRNALLAYLDIRVNTGEISHLEALNVLMDEGYMDKSEAIPNILKIVISPSMALSPYIGFKYFWSMRDGFKTLLGKYYSDRWFNDTLLRMAVLPFDLTKIVMLDEASRLLVSRASRLGFK